MVSVRKMVNAAALCRASTSFNLNIASLATPLSRARGSPHVLPAPQVVVKTSCWSLKLKISAEGEKAACI